MTTPSDHAPLRRLLLLDAATCAATGALLCAAHAPLSRLFALPPALLLGAGAALLPTALLMHHAARRRPLSRPLANLVVAGNAAWVAASALVLALLAPSLAGTLFVVAQGTLVAALGWLERRALRGGGVPTALAPSAGREA